jgi:hypothetical protein
MSLIWLLRGRFPKVFRKTIRLYGSNSDTIAWSGSGIVQIGTYNQRRIFGR